MPLPGPNPVLLPRGYHSLSIRNNTGLAFLYIFTFFVCVPRQCSFSMTLLQFYMTGIILYVCVCVCVFSCSILIFMEFSHTDVYRLLIFIVV